jgi:type I restriction enzyme S subunit
MVNESMRVAMPKINRDTLKSSPILIPPKKEQLQIIQYLEKENASLDTLIQKIKNTIELLKEYRSSLISTTVTGKIDIREEVRA